MLYILTLTWNGYDKLSRLKQSLIPALDGLDYRWIIKDNNSKDNTVGLASLWGDKVKVIAHKDNLQNFSQGTNMCFNEASPSDNDDILLLNNDIIFNDTKSIKNMLHILNECPNVGAVGARLLFTNSNRLQHAGVVFHNKTKAPAHFRLGQESDENATKNRIFQVVTGAVLLTKAEYFRKCFHNSKSGVDGMDENYHWGFDDVDLCLAIKNNMEKQIVYCGKTNIFHDDSASLKKAPTNQLFLTHNLNYLKNKWQQKYCLDWDMYNIDPKFNIFKG